MKLKTLTVNDTAPDFELTDHNGKLFRLSDFKGNNVLLSFHPLAWTSVCAKQMKTLENNKQKFDELNTTAVGISIDSVPSKEAWSRELGIKNIRLISDFWPHGKVAEQYCIFREQDGVSERANIIINENQQIVFIKIYEISKLPDIDEILSFLENVKIT